MEYSKKVELLQELINFISDYCEQDKPDVIKRHASMIIDKVVNDNRYSSAINNIKFTPSMVAYNIHGLEDGSITLKRVFIQGKQEMIALVKTVLKDIEIDLNNKATTKGGSDLNKIFIVHGQEETAKAKTARFIEKLGLEAIILHEQVSSGKTIIEKIEEHTNVGFGIILYTPCDIGGKKVENPKLQSRARQNVVFEHGFLIGKIGRSNVCALVKGNVEIPNDISGVVYITMDEGDAWRYEVARELKKAGYNIDMNVI